MILRGIKKFAGSRTLAGVLFLMPAFVLLSIFSLYPIGRGIFLSLTDLNIISPVTNFIGLSNYVSIINNPIFWKALKNTCYFVILNIPMNYFFALSIAVVLNTDIKAKSFFRVCYFIPVVTSMVVVSILGTTFYEEYGPINNILHSLGFSRLKFLTSTSLAMPSVVVMSVWKSAPYFAILFLAGLQSIPDFLYEAAKLDGADRWQCFRYITLPLLKSTSIFIIVITVIGGFQVFTQIFLMTHGGPARSTTTIVHQIYLQAFQEYKLGYGAAMACILLIILLALTAMQIHWLKVKFKY